MDDLNGVELTYFLVPTSTNERSYQFTIDTTAKPMKTGEWVLRIYEKPNTNSLVITGEPYYIGKVRIYKQFPADTYKEINITDDRFE